VAEDRFGGPSAVGWLFAAISIGAVIGGLSSGWIGRVHRQGVVLTVAIVGWGAAVALAGLGRTLWITVALLAVAGAADLVSAVLRQTVLQVYAPDEMRGRLQGVFVVVVAGGPRLGDLRAGATAARIVACTLPLWLPIIFTAYAIGRCRLTVPMVIVFAIAELLSIGVGYGLWHWLWDI
jgi:MFS family permease